MNMHDVQWYLRYISSLLWITYVMYCHLGSHEAIQMQRSAHPRGFQLDR